MVIPTAHDATPDPVIPSIIMNGIGTSVPLLTAGAEIEGDDIAPIRGAVVLTAHWDGRPMNCSFTSYDTCTALAPSELTRVRIKDRTTGAKTTIQVDTLYTDLQPTLFDDDGTLEASSIPLEDTVHISYDDKSDLVSEVVAHLLNIPQYKGAKIRAVAGRTSVGRSARLRFTGGGWKITIDGLFPWTFQYAFDSYDMDDREDLKNFELWRKRLDALKQVARTGGILLTHALRLERENGSPFRLDGAKKILDKLEAFLTFAFGQRTRPLHAHGYKLHKHDFGEHRSQKWTLLDVRPPLPVSSVPRGTLSWLPRAETATESGDTTDSGVDLSSAFGNFVSLASDTKTRDTLKRAIDWYSAALASFGSPESILLAQAGLELLAWRRITTEMKLKLSQAGPSRLTVADQLRLLLSSEGLSLDIPPELKNLTKLSKAKAQKEVPQDGPEAVTEVRNAAVHAKDNPHLEKEHRIEAQRLAIWYLEMAILRIIGHNGEYWDRLRQKNQLVPWRRSPES